MKRIIKSRIFSFILGAAIFGSIGVFAYAYSAKQITYTPKDSTWKKENGEDITNVKDAIDELHNRSSETTNIDLTSKTTYDNQCYNLESVKAFFDEADNILLIKVVAKHNNTCNDNTTYTVDISDLNLKTITYKSNIDLANSPRFSFSEGVTNINNLSFQADTSFGIVQKSDYDYMVIYSYSK